MNEKLLKEAKDLLGSQFNEAAWIRQLEADEAKAKEQIDLLKKFRGRK